MQIAGCPRLPPRIPAAHDLMGLVAWMHQKHPHKWLFLECQKEPCPLVRERIREFEAELANPVRAELIDMLNQRLAKMQANAERAEAAARTEAGAAQIHFEARTRLEARVAAFYDYFVLPGLVFPPQLTRILNEMTREREGG